VLAWPPPPCSNPSAAAPWRSSPPAYATRSTWAPCTPSCWGWSTRPCNPPTPGCGYDPRPVRCRRAADAAQTVPLAVAAELEPAPSAGRLLAALDVHVLDHPAQLTHPRQGGVHVVHLEEQIRCGPLVPTVDPAGDSPGPDRVALPGRPGLEPPAEVGRLSARAARGRGHVDGLPATPTCSELTRVEVLRGMRSPERRVTERFLATTWGLGALDRRPARRRPARGRGLRLSGAGRRRGASLPGGRRRGG
jgi:hypothetical protein